MKVLIKTIEIIVGAPGCWIAPCLLLNKQGVPFPILIYLNCIFYLNADLYIRKETCE